MTLSGFQEATQHMELVAWHWDIPQRNTSNKIQTLYNGLANVMTWYIKPVIMELVSQKCKKGIDREREGVEVPSQRILEFVEYWQLLRILPNYGFIWQQLQNIDGRFFTSTNRRTIVDWLVFTGSDVVVTSHILIFCIIAL